MSRTPQLSIRPYRDCHAARDTDSASLSSSSSPSRYSLGLVTSTSAAQTGETGKPWSPRSGADGPHPRNRRVLRRAVPPGRLPGRAARRIRPAGGGSHLAATVDQLRAQAGDAILLATGDSIGGTAPEAALLGDRPTIEFFNRLGVDGAGIGRRELDKGADHIRSLVKPGCRTEEECRVDPPLPPFRGAAFPFLASNVIPSHDSPPRSPSPSNGGRRACRSWP